MTRLPDVEAVWSDGYTWDVPVGAGTAEVLVLARQAMERTGQPAEIRAFDRASGATVLLARLRADGLAEVPAEQIAAGLELARAAARAAADAWQGGGDAGRAAAERVCDRAKAALRAGEPVPVAPGGAAAALEAARVAELRERCEGGLPAVRRAQCPVVVALATPRRRTMAERVADELAGQDGRDGWWG